MKVPDRTALIEVADGVSLHSLLWDGGAGIPFVLVHGLSSNAHLWDGVAAELAVAGHPVVAVDLRGHGRSTKPDRGYDMATIAADVARLLQRVDVIETSGSDRPVLVGQSWGGNVVVEVAARFPELPAAIACVDGGAIELSRDFPDWAACAEALRPPALLGTPADEIESMIRRSRPGWPESGIAGTMACFEIRDDGTVAPWLTIDRHLLVLRGLWEHRPSEQFPSIDVPALFLAAASTDADRDRRQAETTSATAGLRDVRVETLVGDHDLHAQHPRQVAALLRTLAR